MALSIKGTLGNSEILGQVPRKGIVGIWPVCRDSPKLPGGWSLFAVRIRLVLTCALNTGESLKELLLLSEMSSVGSPQERAAFISVYIEGQTVRETARTIGTSKSQVSNLAALFLAKLGAKMQELE